MWLSFSGILRRFLACIGLSLCLQCMFDPRTDSLPELALLSLVSFGSQRNFLYFVYVPVGTKTEIYSLNPNDGTLSMIPGSPFSVSAGFADPAGKFMYTGSFAPAPNNVTGYSIDSTTGLLTPTPTPQASANLDPGYMDFTPAGEYVFMENYGSLDVSAFSIDRSTGNLSKISDFATSCACVNLAQVRATPDGKYFYVTGNNGINPITEFSINSSTGNLTLIGNVAAIGGMDAVLVDPTSSYLYAVSNGGTIAGYSINSATGVLTALPGSPFAGVVGNLRGAMHPSGKYLYTVNIGGAQLAKHDIASNGTLSAASTITFGTNLQYITIDPSGRYGFVNDGASAHYYVVAIDQTNGTPSLLAGNPFSASATPGAITAIRIAQ